MLNVGSRISIPRGLLLFQIRGSRTKALHDKALVNCQYSMATFSTGERKRRPRGDRKSQETSMHLRQALQAAIRVEVYPRSQIDVFVEVCLWSDCCIRKTVKSLFYE